MRTHLPNLIGAVCLWAWAPSIPDCENPQGTAVRVAIEMTQEAKPTATVVKIGDRIVDETPFSAQSLETAKIEYVDRFLRVEKSRLMKAEREFLRIEGHHVEQQRPPAFPKEADIESRAVSALEHKTLIFVRSGDSQSFDVHSADEEKGLEATRLQELTVPSFSAVFLCPRNANAADKTWKIPVDSLRDLLLRPGGDLFSFTDEMPTPATKFRARQRIAYWAALEGKIEARLADPEPGEHPQNVTILIDGELSTSCFLPFTEDAPEGRSMKEAAKIKGVVMWDAQHDRLDSVSLEWDGVVHLVQDVMVGTATGDMPGKGEITVSAKSSWHLHCNYEAASTAK